MGRPGDGARIVIEALRRAAGRDAVHPPEAGAWVVNGVTPRTVVQPDNAEAAAAVLALCSEQGWTVEPAGAGTWLDHGRTIPRAIDVVLSTARLSHRIETEPGDLVVGVDAGVPLATLQHRLAQDRQELPLDPPAGDDASIGAIIGTAAAGPLRAGAGTPRDYVLGVQVATGDGQLIRFGGRVVKNVAGYDVVRLLTGSRGTLGVITSAWLRLRAAPAADRTFVLDGEPDDLLQVIAGLRRVRPAAAELLAPATASSATGRSAWRALVRLRGGREELADAAGRMRGIVAGLELTESDPGVWRALGTVEAAAAPVVRVAVRAAETGGLLTLCRQFISESDNELTDWHAALHATVGIARLWPVRPLEAKRAERVAAALVDLRSRVEGEGGSLVLERPGAALQALVSARGTIDPVTLHLELGLKQVMDPAGILGSLA